MGMIRFHKYQGTGNDFVLIDDRQETFDLQNQKLVGRLCHRRFGIGADGVILIRNHPSYDFEMIYFNPDGSQSLCGNGSRCAVRFAHQLDMIKSHCHFLAIDGPHEGYMKGDLIYIKMPDVPVIERSEESFFLDTGSPHHVKIVPEVSEVDVLNEGRSIRNSYGESGSNVNFVQLMDQQVTVRTYERGVEDETLSCGTGVTAVALALSERGYHSPVLLQTRGGELKVSFEQTADGVFTNVYLIGPAAEVFNGSIDY